MEKVEREPEGAPLYPFVFDLAGRQIDPDHPFLDVNQQVIRVGLKGILMPIQLAQLLTKPMLEKVKLLKPQDFKCNHGFG